MPLSYAQTLSRTCLYIQYYNRTPWKLLILISLHTLTCAGRCLPYWDRIGKP